MWSKERNWIGLLRVRGWQLFLILQGVAAFTLVVGWHRAFDGSAVTRQLSWISLASLQFFYFGWAMRLGGALNSYLPAGLRRDWRPPLLGFGISVAYLLSAERLFTEYGFSGPVIVLHLFTMLVNFYLLWYVSRALVALEEQRKPALSGVLGTFFVLWFTMFLPVGSWWVQSRARRVTIPPRRRDVPPSGTRARMVS